MRYERLAAAALATAVVGVIAVGFAASAVAGEDVPTNRGWGTSTSGEGLVPLNIPADD